MARQQQLAALMHQQQQQMATMSQTLQQASQSLQQASQSMLEKKNACALKTPHVVALPFIYVVECSQFHTLLATLKNVFDPVTLILDL